MIIGIDLDGTLLKYSGFKGDDVFGKALPGARAWVRGLYKAGIKMWVFTARATNAWRQDQVERALKRAGFDTAMFEGITNRKLASFSWIVDDRAYRYCGPQYVYAGPRKGAVEYSYPDAKYLMEREPWWRNNNG